MRFISSLFKFLRGALLLFVSLCVINCFLVISFGIDIRPVTLLQKAIGKNGMLAIGVVYSYIFCER